MSSSDAVGAALDQPVDVVYHPDLLLGVLEYHRVNYLAAPPRIGKSCLLYPQIQQYLERRKFLGCSDGATAIPPDIGVLTQHSKHYFQSRLHAMGLTNLTGTNFPIIQTEPVYKGSSHLIEALQEGYSRFMYPKPKLLIIDNLHAYLPSGEVSKFKEPGDFLISLNQWAEEAKITILATVPMVKQKANEGYTRALDRIMGSVNWNHGVGTIICLDYCTARNDDPYVPRKVIITFHGKRELETFWRFRGKHMVEVPISEVLGDISQKDQTFVRYAHLNTLLDSRPANEEITADEIRTWADPEGEPIPQASLYRWIREQIERGRLFRTQRGTYIRTGRPN